MCGTMEDLRRYFNGLPTSAISSLYGALPSGDCDDVDHQVAAPCWCDLKLYLYLDAKPRRYTQENTVNSWLAAETPVLLPNDKRTPMLSNIQVDVAWVMDND